MPSAVSSSLRAGSTLAFFAGSLPIAAQGQAQAQQQVSGDARSEIVALGTSSTVDRTLSSDPVAERMSQSI